MATDATGTPTSPDSIPKYLTSADAPSGKGFNAAMDAIQAALTASYARKPAGLSTGEIPVWNGSAWVRSSTTGLLPTGVQGGVGMQQISDTTLGSAAASIDLTSIPQTFNHLMLILSPESATAAPVDTTKVVINNDTTAADYNWVVDRGNNGAASSANGQGTQAWFSGGVIPGATLNNWSSFSEIWLTNYRSAKNKAYTMRGGFAANSALQGYIDNYIGAWLNVAAINRLTFSTSTGANFAAGSRITLYGIA